MNEKKATRRKQTKGKCVFCGKEYAKGGITRHFASCSARQQAIENAVEKAKKPKTEKILHITAFCEYAPDYWLHFEIPASQTLEKMDQFLRAVWLECCGHLSQFTIGGASYSVYPSGGFGERNMKHKLSKVLEVGDSFDHIYDFGTPTELALKVVGEREGISLGKRRDPVFLMAHNNPPEIMCEECEKNPATEICTICMWDWEEASAFCDTCKQTHHCFVDEGDDYMFLPVVNSPRMGVCAYDGGPLDREDS